MNSEITEESDFSQILDLLACCKSTHTYTNMTKKVGQWKEVLTDTSISLAKEILNSYLLAFGYENDPDWDMQYLRGKNYKNS